MFRNEDEMRSAVAQVKGDINFLKGIPPGKVMTDQMHGEAAHSRLQTAIGNIEKLVKGLDPDPEPKDRPEVERFTTHDDGIRNSSGELVAPMDLARPGNEGGADEVNNGEGAAETAPGPKRA